MMEGRKVVVMTGDANASLIRNKKIQNFSAIVNIFEERKRLFYKIGWTYMQDPLDLEAAFMEAIIQVHDQLSRQKNSLDGDSKVNSIYLDVCRRLSKNRPKKKVHEMDGIFAKDTNREVFTALSQLENTYKEPIVLTYISELPQEEVAQILQLPIETVKSRLKKGVDLLINLSAKVIEEENCTEFQGQFMDYLGRTLHRAEKIKLEMHARNCPSCQQALLSIQEVVTALSEDKDHIFSLPSGFMQRVREMVQKVEDRRKKKKRKQKTIGVAFTGLLTMVLFFGFFTNGYTYLYYSWIGWLHQEDEQLITYLKHGVGEELNMTTESNGIRVTIKSVIADDVQTLIFYEVESLNDENRYEILPFEGVRIANEFDLKNENKEFFHGSFQSSDPSEINNDEKNVYRGQLSIFPLETDNEPVELRISRLAKAVDEQPGSTDSRRFYYENIEFLDGDWSFDIPVKKQASIVHELDQVAEIDDVFVTFKQLTIAPTATILHLSYENQNSYEMIHNLSFESLETKKMKVEPDLFGGSSFFTSDGNSYQASFDSVFFENPDEVNVHFASMNLLIEEENFAPVNFSKEFPQTFEFRGSTISIDEVKYGNPTKMMISDELVKNREYESLEFDFVDDNGGQPTSWGMSSEGVWVDRNGEKLEGNSYFWNPYNQKEQSRYFQTKYEIEIGDETSEDTFIPTQLKIRGYTTTKFLDDSVIIVLD
ncbi:DUF4179 domain-containing protein [Bacillus sp. 2205SS5-2]|uniref:DUF4179 domain-containing protein n=1 Tax=Bacillus sp. 2205SS5-2 TaxID=3109031 RepID=UPI003007114E